MSAAVTHDISARLASEAKFIDRALADWIGGLSTVSDHLRKAMAYSLLAGGKRIRPVLTLWSCELCGGSRSVALPAALAVECVHTFSLIHDDLPALDDDEYRRGRPTCHKQFGEATAILAGDALLAAAFDLLADYGRSRPFVVGKLVRELAQAAGTAGVIGGEALDLAGETEPPDAAAVRLIHAAKTARLIQSACRLGALVAAADEQALDALSNYGLHLGLAFQAADDLLDVTACSERLGKAVGKDAAADKQTYPRAVGLDQTREIASQHAGQAEAALSLLRDRAADLQALAGFVVDRDH